MRAVRIEFIEKSLYTHDLEMAFQIWMDLKQHVVEANLFEPDIQLYMFVCCTKLLILNMD